MNCTLSKLQFVRPIVELKFYYSKYVIKAAPVGLLVNEHSNERGGAC